MSLLRAAAQQQIQATAPRSVPLLPRSKNVQPRAGNAQQRKARQLNVVASYKSPARVAIGGLVSSIYKVTAALQPAEDEKSPLWKALKKIDLSGVKAAISAGADVNERNSSGDTALLMIAREGHYKYPPQEIPAALVQAKADLEAKDSAGLTALEVSLLKGWQNIAELLIKSGASTSGVAGIKSRLTCPDCKALVAEYKL